MKKKNSYAVITGASSGIGAEFAKRLAAEGYDLILIARREERLKKISEKLKKLGTECMLIEADLSKISNCRKLIDYISKRNIGIFINNARFGDCGAFLESDTEKELNMIDLNVKALHYLTKGAAKIMDRQGYGYILNVASSAGLIPAGPYMATYYATKAYVTSLTRAVAEEFKQKNSRVYIGCLCPGPVDTEFNDVANVKFALKGISPSYCANYAIDVMKKRRIVIVPTLKMKLAVTFGRFISQPLYIKIVSHQQKKKIRG